MTVSRTLAQYLIDAGHGTGFADLLPDQPDACFSVNEYPGRNPIWEHGSIEPGIERPSVQLVIRGVDVASTRQRAECDAPNVDCRNEPGHQRRPVSGRPAYAGWLDANARRITPVSIEPELSNRQSA